MTTKASETKKHLANLLEAVQRCAYFLHGSESRITWPVEANELSARNKDIDLFETLSAVNERFSKLQDTLASAMRHAALLSGESDDTFLRVLAFFEKVSVLPSMEDWQTMRALRNLAAHEYELDYAEIAEHFNSLKELIPQLYKTAAAFLDYCQNTLHVGPSSNDFTREFAQIVSPSPTTTEPDTSSA